VPDESPTFQELAATLMDNARHPRKPPDGGRAADLTHDTGTGIRRNVVIGARRKRRSLRHPSPRPGSDAPGA
jgi:hypothetical protein